MDPTACLQRILESIEDYHKAVENEVSTLDDMRDDYKSDVIEHLYGLLHWLERGGFMPSLPGKYTPGRQDQAV